MRVYREHFLVTAFSLEVCEEQVGPRIRVIELDIVVGRKFLLSVHKRPRPQPLSDELVKEDWKPTIVPRDTPKAEEMARIRDEKINGFLTIPENWLDSGPAGPSNRPTATELRIEAPRLTGNPGRFVPSGFHAYRKPSALP